MYSDCFSWFLCSFHSNFDELIGHFCSGPWYILSFNFLVHIQFYVMTTFFLFLYFNLTKTLVARRSIFFWQRHTTGKGSFQKKSSIEISRQSVSRGKVYRDQIKNSRTFSATLFCQIAFSVKINNKTICRTYG